MTLRLAAVAGLGLWIGLAASAAAQNEASLTLYDQSDYRGASATFYGSHAAIGSTGFANRARSAQVRGTWRLCEGGGYRNHCEVLTGNVPNLSAYGLDGRVGSAELVSPPAGAAYAPRPAPQSAPSDRYAAAPYAAPPPAYAQEPAYQPAYGDAPPYREPRRDDRGRRRGADRYASEAEGSPYGAAPDYDRYAPRPLDEPDDRVQPPPAYAEAAPPEPVYQPAPPEPEPAPPPQTYAPQPQAYAPPAPAYAPAPEVAAPEDVEGAQGYTTVFFPRPATGGFDLSARRADAADAFCRSRGLARALYAEARQRSARSLDPDGRTLGEGPILTDVLCQRN